MKQSLYCLFFGNKSNILRKRLTTDVRYNLIFSFLIKTCVLLFANMFFMYFLYDKEKDSMYIVVSFVILMSLITWINGFYAISLINKAKNFYFYDKYFTVILWYLLTITIFCILAGALHYLHGFKIDYSYLYMSINRIWIFIYIIMNIIFSSNASSEPIR